VLAANDPAPAAGTHGIVKTHVAPAVAVKSDGTYAIVWVEKTGDRHVDFFIDYTDPISARVVAQVYTSTGAPKGGRLEVVKLAGQAVQENPRIVATSDGFWIAYDQSGGTGDGVHVRRIDKNGKLGTPAFPGKGGHDPAIATGGNGLLLVWNSCCASGNRRQISGLLYKTTGQTIGSTFVVSNTLGRNAGAPSVAGRAGGDFMVTWPGTLVSDTSTRVFARLVAKTGALPGTELAVSPGDGVSPRATTFAGTRWGLSWVTMSGLTRVAVSARTSDKLGNLTPVVKLSEGVPSTVDLSLVGGPDGRVVATWVGRDSNGNQGIHARLAKSKP
jgi:hypothetical protein